MTAFLHIVLTPDIAAGTQQRLFLYNALIQLHQQNIPNPAFFPFIADSSTCIATQKNAVDSSFYAKLPFIYASLFITCLYLMPLPRGVRAAQVFPSLFPQKSGNRFCFTAAMPAAFSIYHIRREYSSVLRSSPHLPANKKSPSLPAFLARKVSVLLLTNYIFLHQITCSSLLSLHGTALQPGSAPKTQ